MYNTQVEPERILEFSIQDGLSCYKVRWHDSWVPQESLSHSWQHLIDHFWKTQSDVNNQANKFNNRFLPNFATMLNLNTYASSHHPLAGGHHPNTNAFLNPPPHHHIANNDASGLGHYHHMSAPVVHHQADAIQHADQNSTTHLQSNLHMNMGESTQNNHPVLSTHPLLRPAHLNTTENHLQQSIPSIQDFNIIDSSNQLLNDPNKPKASKHAINQRHIAAKKLLTSAKTRVVRKVKQKSEELEMACADGVTCNICHRDFSRTSKPKKRLREHFRRMHLKNGKFKCSHCAKTFVCQQGLRDHEPVHSKKRNHSCRYCGETFLRLSHLYVHLRTHEEERNFRCEACLRTFNVQSELKEHCTTEHSTITADMTCGVCKQNLYSATSVYSHSLRHSGTRDHKCDQCGMAFKRKQILDQHKKRHELDASDQKTLECRICKNIFSTKASLRDHASSVHQTSLEETEHKCETCHKTFRNWANYRRHMLMHTKVSDDDSMEIARVQEEQIRKQYGEGDEGKHQLTCNVCQTVLKTVKLFLEHLQAHQQNVSETIFSEEVDKEHVADNTLQDLSCSVCQKTFTKRKYLKSHMDIHSNIELKCDVCGMVFKRRDTLRIHRKRHVVRNENAQNYRGRVGEIYNNRKELRDKIGAPDKDGNVSCPYCDKTFSKRKLLLAHIVLHGNVYYSCDICGKSYKQRSCLNKHKRSHDIVTEEEEHNETTLNSTAVVRAKSYKCDICKRAYAYKKRLMEHKKIHENELSACDSTVEEDSLQSINETNSSEESESYRCQACDHKFQNEDFLIHHMNTNHTKKTIKTDKTRSVVIKVRGLGQSEDSSGIVCDDMGAKNESSNTQENRERSVMDKISFVCSNCGEEFPTIKRLQMHMVSHEPLQFPCSICNRVFNKKESLSRHMVQVHGIRKFGKQGKYNEKEDDNDGTEVNDKVVEILKESLMAESGETYARAKDDKISEKRHKSGKISSHKTTPTNSSNTIDPPGGNVIVVVVEKDRNTNTKSIINLNQD